MSAIGVATDEPVFNAFSLKVLDGLTALAGGGQGVNPLPPGFGQYRFATVSNNNDSATLPQGTSGKFIIVVNADATHSLNLFPFKGDQINALGSNSAFAIAANKAVICFCTKTAGNGIMGQWHTVTTA